MGFYSVRYDMREFRDDIAFEGWNAWYQAMADGLW